LQISSNEQFFDVLKALVDSWCERRCLQPLARVLGPYVAFYGLTDDWAELQNALKSVRALDRDILPEAEFNSVGDLINAIDRTLSHRN
jgi:hypothetical protein